MSKKIILSIDGGGIRGIIPLCALIEMERQIGKPAREVVSFVAGTSTGAIIAAGLAMGLSAARVLELYQEAGPAIFRMDTLGWIFSGFSYRYKTKPMADLIRRYINEPLMNQSPIDIMLSATRVEDGKNWYFVRDNSANAQSTGKLSMVDCITASSAAPTYFEPWKVGDIGPCVDGGVGVASNPVYQAAVEAFYYTPAGMYGPANSIIISLGTGFYPSKNSPQNIVDWLQFTIGKLLEAPSTQQNAIVYRHFPEASSYRWNPQLPRDIGLDGVNEIPALIEIGTQMSKTLDWKAMLAGSTDQNKVGPHTRGMGRN